MQLPEFFCITILTTCKVIFKMNKLQLPECILIIWMYFFQLSERILIVLMYLFLYHNYACTLIIISFKFMDIIKH